MVQTKSYKVLFDYVTKQPLGSGLEGVILATRNTFINFLEVPQRADRRRSKSVPPRPRSSSSGEYTPGTPRSCATAPPSAFSQMAIASAPGTPVQQVVQVARRCQIKNKLPNSISSTTDAAARLTHKDHRWDSASSLTDSPSSDRNDVSAAHELAGTTAEDDNNELLTVMLRNIPCRCSQQDLIDMLTDHGWAGAYNFFHLPMPRGKCKGNLGYAFIGFPTTELAQEFMYSMKGLEFSSRKSSKVLDVSPARIQGLNNNFALTGKHAVRAAGTTCDSSKQVDDFQEAIEAFMGPSVAKCSLKQQGTARPCGQWTLEKKPEADRDSKCCHVHQSQHI